MGTAHDESVEGWSNRPTWCVNMWLANDRKLHAEALKQARRFKHSREDLAAVFKRWVTDDLAPDLGNSFAADLLGYALGEVDWYELAEEWITTAAQVPA